MILSGDNLPHRALILDGELIRRVYADRVAHGNRPHDEVWDGVLVLYPLPNNEHRQLVSNLAFAFAEVQPGAVLPGCNVSDRDKDWLQNCRNPDVAVYLASNPAKDADTHWVGGPDLAVEVVSPGEDPRQKLDFYAKVKTREVLIVDRDPWALELYQLKRGKLVLVGKSEVANAVTLACVSLPLTLWLVTAEPRPIIAIAHTSSKQTWTA